MPQFLLVHARRAHLFLEREGSLAASEALSGLREGVQAAVSVNPVRNLRKYHVFSTMLKSNGKDK